jgi:hypothetical protein
MYLFPERFKTMHTRAKLTGLSTLDLVESLQWAADITNHYVNLPLTEPASLLGGRIVGERHEWRWPDSLIDQPTRRVYPYHWPVKEIESLSIVIAAHSITELPLQTLVKNDSLRFIEVTYMVISPTIQFLPTGSAAKPMAEITYTYGWEIEALDDRLWPVTTENLVFQSSHGHWLAGAEVEVRVDDVAVDPGDYDVDRDEGRVTFSAARTGRVSADYVHRLPRAVEKAQASIAAFLISGTSGKSALLSPGVSRVRAGEIEVAREKLASGSDPSALESYVPDAAQLLSGYRNFRVAA